MTTTLRPRSDWTAKNPRTRTALKWPSVRWVVIHWPGSKGKLGTNIPALLRGWYDYHTRVKGWTDIAYNYAVDQQGRAWTLRGPYIDGATKNYGGRSVSILAVLGDAESPSPAMLKTLKTLALQLKGQAATGCKIVGHRNLIDTDCPGDKIAAWIKAGMQTAHEPTTPLKMIIVAGSANTTKGVLHSKYRRRLAVALPLLRKYPSMQIIVTGGIKAGRGPRAEADLAQEWLIAQGIPANRIITENRSGSTRGNFVYGMPLAKRHGATAVIIISDRSHMRRCLAMAYATIKAQNLALKIGGVRWYPDRSTQDATVTQATHQARTIWEPITTEHIQYLDGRWKVAPYPIIKLGSRGPVVRRAQRLLGVTVDGIYGPKTRVAVVRHQTKHKLVDDGIIGPNTWATLENPA